MDEIESAAEEALKALKSVVCYAYNGEQGKHAYNVRGSRSKAILCDQAIKRLEAVLKKKQWYELPMVQQENPLKLK